MKGIILAGGLGTRLSPLTNPLNKHLLPVYDKPMIVHAIETLVAGGIHEIMVLLNGYHPGLFLEMLKDGLHLGCHLTYRYEEIRGEGPGNTLLLAERWVGQEDFVLILGDGVFFTELTFANKQAPHMFVMPLAGDDDPSKYGQVKISEGRVTEMVWKPTEIFSDLIQTTCFILPKDAFARIRQATRLANGEWPITALTQQYVDAGLMTCTELPPQSYIDCGTIDALSKAGIRQMTRKI